VVTRLAKNQRRHRRCYIQAKSDFAVEAVALNGLQDYTPRAVEGNGRYLKNAVILLASI